MFHKNQKVVYVGNDSLREYYNCILPTTKEVCRILEFSEEYPGNLIIEEYLTDENENEISFSPRLFRELNFGENIAERIEENIKKEILIIKN